MRGDASGRERVAAGGSGGSVVAWLRRLIIRSTSLRCIGLIGYVCSNRHVVAGAFGCAAAPLVVDLRGGDVAVAQEVLHLPDVHAGIEQQGGRGGP